MQAAIAAGRRGHKVTLWEKNSKLGGELLAAVCPPGKGEFASYIIALQKQLSLLPNVEVVLNKTATAEDVLAFGADKVILAAGGKPNLPRFLGERDNIIPAREILLGHRQAEGPSCPAQIPWYSLPARISCSMVLLSSSTELNFISGRRWVRS